MGSDFYSFAILMLVLLSIRLSKPSIRNSVISLLGAVVAWAVSAGTSPWGITISLGLTALAFAMSPLIAVLTRGFANLAAKIHRRAYDNKENEEFRQHNPSQQNATVTIPELLNPESINVLHNPDNAIVDIVAVHGLGSSVETSWTHPASQTLWLRDFLPRDIPDARVMTFRHNSGWRYKALVKDLPDYGKQLLSALRAIRATEPERPLILVGHSFGGLLIEQALVIAKRPTTDERIAHQNEYLTNSLAGIIFLGTPHAGSGYSTLGKLYCLFHYWDGASTTLLRYLDVESTETERLEDEFLASFDRVPSIDYHECVPNTILGFNVNLIVTKSAATRAGRTSEALDTDHFGLNKFENEKDDSYKKIKHTIVEFTKAKTESDKEQADKNGPSSFYFDQVPEEDPILPFSQGHNQTVVLGWLLDLSPKSTYPKEFYDKYENGLHTGISERSLSSDAFRTWRTGDKKWLLCHGMPGAGKTSLATIVITELLDMRATTRNRNIGVAYLYCVHSDKTQSAKNFLKAILHQLAQQSQELSDELKTLYINHNAPSPPTSPKFDEYEAVLESEVQRFEEVYLVVDAIDECRADDENEDQPNNIRSKLLDTFRYLGDKISLLVTSRERSLNSEERDRTPSFASMEVIATDKEIKLYVEKYIKVKPETSLVRLTKKPEVMDRIQEAVAIRAAGMFLPAKLYVDHIAAIASRPSRYKLSGVMAALQKLPYFQEVKELRQSYQQAYANILKGLWDEKDDDDIELARAIFSWASCCRDPLDLTIDMVKRAWYLEKEQGTEEPRNEDFSTDSDYDEVLEDKKLEDRILSVCRGLIVIDQQSRNIRFVHYTAEEYFSDPDVRQKHLPGAQEEIARSCIKCILSQGSDRNGAGHVQLYRYASLHWGHHARVEEAALKSELHDVFFLRPNHIHESFRAVVDSIAPRGIDPYSQYGAHETIEPLHIAAYFGLRSTTIALLEARANIESKDSRGWTTMRWAIIGRSLELVKLLFDRKADMFSKDNTGDLTIFWAVSSHRRDLHFGSIITDINCQATFGDIRMVGSSESFTTALDRHTAAITSQPIIEFLLKELAHNTLEVRDKLGRTLLSAVAANWQWEAVEILCNRHADINAKDTSGMTPLLSALRPACSRIIHDLSLNGKSAIRIGDVIKVKPGTELNIGDSDYAERMIEPHIGRLIGDDLESRNENGRTALSLAAQWGFHSVVRSLLEKGADPKTTDIHKMTPLHWACSLPGFNTAIRNLKCEGEVRVHLKATELQIRVSKLKRFTGGPIERSVEQLLRYGADTGALNNFAETALDLALSVGLQSHARMLNEYEAMTRKGLSRCSQASASFWAPNTMQIQDYGHKLLALIGQGSRFAIKNLLVSDNVSLQIDSTSTISNLLTDGMSHVIIENEPRILNWRASGKSSIDISALPEQREKLRSDEPLATSQPHGETNGARIDVDVVVARIGRFGQARIVNLSLDGESHLRVGADAIVGRMKVSGRSQVWTRGQSSISYLRVTGSARLTVQGESNVTAIEVSGCGKVYTQGRCTVSRITTKGQARLGVRAAAQISAMRVIEASKVWTTGKTATLAVEVANRARLRVGGESTIDRMVVSHFSQVDIRNASRIRKLLVEQKSFVVLQAEAKVDDILAKHSSLVITTGCSEILTLHACSKARVFILNSYRQQPIKCLVEHKARLLYRGKLLDNEGEPSPHFDVRDSAQASQLEVDDSQPITEVMKKLRIHPLAKRQGEDHVEDNLDDIMVMEETGLLRWEGEEEGENEDDDGYEADDGYEVDDGHEVDDGYGGDGGYEDDGGY